MRGPAAPDGASPARSGGPNTEETWARVEPLLGRYGITRVADVTHLDHIGIPVSVAVRPLAETYATTQSAGLTPSMAHGLAAMRSVELAHAEAFDPPAFEATAYDLELPYSVDALNTLPTSGPLAHVKLAWTPGRTLLGGAPVPLPLQLLRLSFVPGVRGEPRVLRASRNGLASGGTLPEAALEGLYRVVERHALASLGAEGPDPRVRVDLATLDDAHLRGLLDRLADASTQIEVALVRNALAVPVFLAFVWSPLHPLVAAGVGADLDLGAAMCRAIGQAVQARLTRIMAVRDDLPSECRPPHSSDPLLATSRGRAVAEVTEGYRAAHDDPDAALEDVARRVEAHTGMPPLLAELSTDGDPFSVVRVVCPGLDHARRDSDAIRRLSPCADEPRCV
ncbi:ribosomal protein S12 methylthiotransferase accessory factor [Streptomyces zhaozhouensis]|uniref:Ribosomal protein S12 methylthiotransferase accessory factor n=1 Tax=Streptomyces zhaozhouensis TaxID=1300267 RepID=A0A286DVZ4_9ACTN|nr:YcaO-like family protein [Streptomyces zhaozhouensis]SOD62845.1 ribosomal protein S12 methylthiotransferase accessory factor [Streptomyces zhaozhouensis]